MDNDTLNSLLSDPDKLQQAMQSVSAMFGGAAAAPTPSKQEYDPSAEVMEKAMPVLGAIMQSGQKAVKTEKRILLNAFKPFVTDEVATQFDRAMRLVSVARMARGAMGQIGHHENKDFSDNGPQSL